MNRFSLLSVFLLLSLLCIFFPVTSAFSSSVFIVDLSGTIDQAAVELVSESIEEAERSNAVAIVFLLDTPGGGLQQTFDIAERIQQSEIPVIGYVYPRGAAAWSAGTFVLMSTHLAAMAEHTVIGSCQPVEITMGGTQPIHDSKTINALVEWMQERANMYGRNATLVSEFITQNLNVNASEAEKFGVVEVVAPSVSLLLSEIDGMVVVTAAGDVLLQTKNATFTWYTPSAKVQFLKIVSNPIITSILFMLGIFALIFGISAPGHGAEVFGVIAVLLSLIGSGFAVSELGIIFIMIGGLLLLIELLVIPGFGVVGIGGVLCLIIGSVFLIPTYSTREWVISVAWVNTLLLIVSVATILIAGFFLFLLYKVLQVRKKKNAVGVFKGESAVTIDRLTPETSGYVRFKGELWQARSDTVIEKNTKVVIVEKDGVILVVKPLNDDTKH